MKLDGQIAKEQRLHEKRPDLFPEPDYAEWFDVFSRILRKNENKPQIFYVSSSNYSDNTRQMLDELKERIDKSSWAASRWDVIDDPIGINDWVRNTVVAYTQGDIDATLTAWRYFNQIKTEETKMDAKKCERCGKLYEMKDADDYISAYMPALPVSDWTKENFTESRIRKDNTRFISVNFRGGEIVDLCPECREKLKNFF